VVADGGRCGLDAGGHRERKKAADCLPSAGKNDYARRGGEAAGGGVGNEREVEWRRQVEGGRALITGASPTAS
jgi:hypothetical protein